MKPILSILIGCFLSLSVFAQTMTIAPHMIVVNAQGHNLDVQTIYGGPLNGTITSFDVSISFAGTEVSGAYNFEYCYTDNNFIATFDREEIMNNPFIISLANTGEVIASIEGCYTTLDSNGNSNTFIISYKWDFAEIVKPGKKK